MSDDMKVTLGVVGGLALLLLVGDPLLTWAVLSIFMSVALGAIYAVYGFVVCMGLTGTGLVYLLVPEREPANSPIKVMRVEQAGASKKGEEQ